MCYTNNKQINCKAHTWSYPQETRTASQADSFIYVGIFASPQGIALSFFQGFHSYLLKLCFQSLFICGWEE